MRPIGLIGLIGPIGLIILCLTLVSCGGGGDDDLGAPQTAAVNNELVPITFNGSQGIESAVTRASGTPLSETGVTQFHVWGYKNMTSETQTVFPGYQVNWGANTAKTTSSNTSGWEYVNQQPTANDPEQSIKYWDWGAADYRFFAVTKTTSKEWTHTEPDASTDPHKFSITADATSEDAINATPYFSHLWYSTGQLPTYADKQFGKPVTLEFLKPFSRVRFIFKYVYPREGIKLKDPSFKPTDVTKKIARKGTVTVKYPMTGTETQELYETTIDPSGELADFTEDFDTEDDTKPYAVSDKGWYTVVPNINQGSYTLSVEINKTNKTAVVPAEYMQWLPGYSYTYIFKVTEEGGVEIGWVEYAVTPWVNLTSQQKLVYNW